MGMQQIPFTTARRNPPRLVTIDRDRLEALIASAIEMLDLIDGDPDMENLDVDLEDDDPDHCLAGDEGLHQIRGADGQMHWGSSEYHYGRAPNYGIDQTEPRPVPDWFKDKRS